MSDLIDQLISTASTRTSTVRVFARGDLVEAHAEALKALSAGLPDEDGDLAGDPDLDDRIAGLDKVVQDLQAEMEASAVEIRITTISAETWANVLRKFPPTPEDRKGGYDHDTVKFPPAAVAACALEPKISPQQASDLMKRLHPGEWNKLWLGVYALNATQTPSPKLMAVSELLRAKRPSPQPWPLEGSLAAPSSVGDGEQ